MSDEKYFNTAKSISLRDNAIDARLTELRLRIADDFSGKIVNKHLQQRADKFRARADFFSMLADYFSKNGINYDEE